MNDADDLFGSMLALAALSIALAAPIFAPSTAEGRLREPAFGRSADAVARDVLPEYAELRKLTPEALAQSAHARRIAAIARLLAPAVPSGDWQGVALIDKRSERRDPEAILAAFAADPAHEEGPPAHFIVDSAGRAVATPRWAAQRPGSVPGLAEPRRWIVVWMLGDRDRPEAALALEALTSPELSRGGLAFMPEGGPPQIERAPRAR
jgi:hypothetical protein